MISATVSARRSFGQAGQRLLRFRIEIPCSRGFEPDEIAEGRAFMVLEEIGFAVLEFFQILLGKVDSSLFRVCRQIPKNIGELKGHAEVNGIILSMGRGWTEDVQAYQPDDRGDSVTIQRQLLEGP